MKKLKPKWRNPVKWLILVLSMAALGTVGYLACSMFIDYVELLEIGPQYTEVFWINFNVEVFSFLMCFDVSLAVLLVNAIILRKNLENSGREMPLHGKFSLYLFVSFVISLIIGITMSQSIYDKVLVFLNASWFNLGDPVFNQDIGYYIFQRPFLMAMVDSLSFLFLLTAFLTGALYFVSYTINQVFQKQLFHERPVLLHIFFDFAIYIGLRAVFVKFDLEEILFSEFAGIRGAGYTDIHLWKVFYRFAPLLMAVVLVLAFYFLFFKKIRWRQAIASVLIYPVAFVAVSISAYSVQKLYVSPNEATVEYNNILNNIEATRHAFHLDEVETTEFQLKNDLTAEDIQENSDFLQNIRTIDYNQNLVATGQLQSIRNYYTFQDSDTVVYNMNGKKVALNTAVRELDTEKLDAESKKFVNKRLRFTHGYGLVMNPLNYLNEEGQPQFVVKDIPTFSYQGAPEVMQPRIYYGEVNDDWVVAGGSQREFDYSEGNSDVEYSYTGASGISMSFWNRLLFSIRYGDLNLLISGSISPESKLLINRNIMQRVQCVAPFLTYDPDPYPVVDDEGRIQWIIEAYTTSADYPYATEYNGVNYIRNAARAVVDAYDGSVTFYVVDEEDPMIQTYRKMYPSIFSEEPLPADLAEKVKYPESLFKMQSALFARYHVTEPTQLYNKTDVWTIAKEKYSNDVKDVEPYYNLMSVGENSPEELVLMLPYTIENKDNMVSWLAAHSEGENYGKLTCYTFPAGQNVYGPLQIDNRIDSDSVISKELSLWNQGGSTVIRGNLLVIPIENSLLYVEPVYITSSSESNLPEVKRVIVAYGNRIVMEPTLEQALTTLFSVNIGSLTGEEQPMDPDEVSVDDTVETLIDKAVILYDQVEADMKAGDWETFGQDFQKFSSLIKLIKNKRMTQPGE